MATQFDFTGRAVLVTDAQSELGSHAAAAFHELGAHVAVHAETPAAAAALVARLGGGARLLAAPGDLSSMPDVARMAGAAITKLGRMDVLVCSTARGGTCALRELDPARWEATLRSNLKSAFFAAQACVGALSATGGSIVYVASAIGLLGGPPGAVAYATAKGALVQMSRMMALELAGSGIRVNALCPAYVEAEDSPGASPGGMADAFAEWFERRAPLHRRPTPQECAAAIVWLASPMAGATTGSVLTADGGLTSGHYL